MKIKFAEKDDLPSIIKIHLQHFKGIKQTKKIALKIFETGNLSRPLFVAINAQGNIQGYVQLYLAGDRIYMSWLGVDPKSFGKGVGSQLLDSAKKWAKSMKAVSISLDTRNQFKNAIILYLKKGYDVTGTWPNPDGGLMISLRLKL